MGPVDEQNHVRGSGNKCYSQVEHSVRLTAVSPNDTQCNLGHGKAKLDKATKKLEYQEAVEDTKDAASRLTLAFGGVVQLCCMLRLYSIIDCINT